MTLNEKKMTVGIHIIKIYEKPAKFLFFFFCTYIANSFTSENYDNFCIRVHGLSGL